MVLTAANSLLEVEHLSVRFDQPGAGIHAVNDVSFDIAPGETLAVVGESGSGKSVSMLSIMGLVPSPPARISGSIRLQGQELVGLSARRLNRLRGRDMAMVFQEPMSSLNPVHRVGDQIGESLRIHRGLARAEARRRAVALLDRVGIPSAADRAGSYPHELSGGMTQRAMIAMALACDPKLLIADEPTTALDVTVQAQIVDLIGELQDERRLAVIWVTHDLGVVAEIADRVAVMYGGRLLETGSARRIYRSSRHPYTLGLLHSIPRLDRPTVTRLPEIPGAPIRMAGALRGCPFDSRCPMVAEGCADTLPELETVGGAGHRSACLHHRKIDSAEVLFPETPAAAERGSATAEDPSQVLVSVRALKVHFPATGGLARRRAGAVRALDGVDLDIERGRTLGLVGESGCGKTTLGRALVALVRPTEGAIDIKGRPINHRSGPHQRVVQMIFQDPLSAMNPGMRARDVIAEPIRLHRLAPPDGIRERAVRLMEQVGLPPDSGDRYPHEFSGGQRQRIAVARALAADPEVVVCDEPVSALDVSVQAQVVNLLADVQAATGMAIVFISHDLAVVRHISHRVAVMYMGEIVEQGDRDRLYEDPLHPYTRALLAAVPVPEPEGAGPGDRTRLAGELPSPADPPGGCRFHTRCPVAVKGLCSTTKPRLAEASPGRWVSCHLVNPPCT